MNANLQFDFIVDKENKKVNVKREFAATLDKVWAAWTQSELLDQWWAPKPWKSETKSMDFTEGGRWIYAMRGPNGEEHWSRADFKTIDPKNSYSVRDAFTDADGNIIAEMPQSDWMNRFTSNGDHTLVDITITHDKLEDLEKIIAMGFKEGFTMGLGNLDELLGSQK